MHRFPGGERCERQSGRLFERQLSWHLSHYALVHDLILLEAALPVRVAAVVYSIAHLEPLQSAAHRFHYAGSIEAQYDGRIELLSTLYLSSEQTVTNLSKGKQCTRQRAEYAAVGSERANGQQ